MGSHEKPVSFKEKVNKAIRQGFDNKEVISNLGKEIFSMAECRQL